MPLGRAGQNVPPTSERLARRLITLQRTEGSNGQFSIWANGTPGDSINFADSFPSHSGEGYVLGLGGFTGEPAELFYGRVAEIIIFKGALGRDDRSAITCYLTERHQL